MTTLNLTPETVASAPISTSAGWSTINAEVQSILSGLDGPVSRQFSRVRVREHPPTSGGNLLFMSYREFGFSDRPALEAILASVECWKLQDGSWKMTGDLCGEETGRGHYAARDIMVSPQDMIAVRKAAWDLARDVSAHSTELIAALKSLDGEAEE